MSQPTVSTTLPTDKVLAVFAEYGNLLESAVDLLKEAEVQAQQAKQAVPAPVSEDLVLQKIASTSRPDIEQFLERLQGAGFLRDQDMEKLADELQTSPGGLAKLASRVLDLAIEPAHAGGQGIARTDTPLTAPSNGNPSSYGTLYRVKSAAEEQQDRERELRKERELWKQAAAPAY
jgi:hypothetical protein